MVIRIRVHSVPTVPLTGTNSQAVRLFAQPFHSCFCAIRRVDMFFNAIAFEGDLIPCGAAMKRARPVQVLDRELVLPTAACDLKKCPLGSDPFAEPLVSRWRSIRAGRTRCDRSGVRLAIVAASDEHDQRRAGDHRSKCESRV
jgi:hypothetical protein